MFWQADSGALPENPSDIESSRSVCRLLEGDNCSTGLSLSKRKQETIDTEESPFEMGIPLPEQEKRLGAMQKVKY